MADMTWTKKLTKKQLVHLMENGVTTMEGVERQAKNLSTQRFPCWDCVEVCRAVGVEFELTAFNNGQK